MNKVSVILCTYNGEKYIKEQMDSILQQTHKNIELIITDDGSSDHTIDIIKKYQKDDTRIKLFQNESNFGYVKNFGKAISLAFSEYIALADQDDIWEYDKLEKLLFAIKSNDSLMVYSDALLVDSNLNSLNKKLLDNIYPMKGKNNLYFLFNNSVSGNTVLFKKELKQKALPFPEYISFHDIWLAFVASSFHDITYVNEALVKYRQHDDNVTNIQKIKKKKNYVNKLNSKLESQNKFNQKLVNYVYYLENNLPEHENLTIFKNLLKEYLNYEKYLWNIVLFKLLYANRYKLFFSKKKTRILKIFKMSLGYKAYKFLPFI